MRIYFFSSQEGLRKKQQEGGGVRIKSEGGEGSSKYVVMEVSEVKECTKLSERYMVFTCKFCFFFFRLAAARLPFPPPRLPLLLKQRNRSLLLRRSVNFIDFPIPIHF